MNTRVTISMNSKRSCRRSGVIGLCG